MTDTVIQIEVEDTIVVNDTSIEVVSMGIQGPPGGVGSTVGLLSQAEADALYAVINHAHTISNITGLQAVLDALAPLASPPLTGIPTAPTAALGTNTTQIATMAALQAAIADLVASSPTTLNTLNEIATALGNDPNFATTIIGLLAGKAALSHSHAIADVTNLQNDLDGKAAQVHAHPISDVTGLQNELDGKSSRTGFPVDATGGYLCTTSYDETTRTITITPTSSTFDVYVAGIKHTKTGAQSISHPNTQGGHFIYFDVSGALVASTTVWNLLITAPVMFVFWDATNSRAIPFEERHHAGRDVYWHRNQHAAEGTKATSGFAIADYTLNDGTTDTALTFSVATGRVEDEDIRVDTQALPDNGPYTIIHRAGVAGDWMIERGLTRPFLDSGTALQYNQNNGGTWQRTVVTEDFYVNYWVFATTALPTTSITPAPASTQQIFIVPGQSIYATDVLAHGETVGSLSWGNIPFQEIAPLYQITLRYNASNPQAFANTVKCAISRIIKIIGSGSSIMQSALVDHGTLTGLADDDHLQYTKTLGAVRAEIDLGSSPTDANILSWSAAQSKLVLTAPSAGGGGWGTPVFTWTHSVNVAAVSIPIVDGIYEMQAYLEDAGVSKAFQLSADGGTSVTTFSLAKAIGTTFNASTGTTSQAGTVGSDYTGILGSSGIGGVRMDARIVVSSSAKKVAIYARSFATGYGGNVIWLDNDYMETAATQNTLKVVAQSGNFLTGSFIKVWKVA